MTGQSSTYSSFDYQWTYDVFINFRGEDTRHGFTGNLYNALSQKGIRTFFDDVELRKGNEITPTLLKAIEESRMAITIFSKNYASSTFCLRELVKILQCIKQNGRLVWPIFYDVEPSDVRHQKGNYEKALAMHKTNLKADEEEMQRWKLALHEVANLSGSHFSPRDREYEYQFIERIMKEISSKINRVPLHVADYPVGLESRVLEINSLLGLGSNDEVNMVGICGIGGIGKTTIARAVYNSIADNFEGLCFLYDIQENSRKHGLEQMQERMLSKTIGLDTKVVDVNEGVPIIKMRLKQKKILLILDNVDNPEQLKYLAGWDWFGSGSRIIITTRDKQLLGSHGVVTIYDMKAFNDKESFELLTWKAFRNNQVYLGYREVLNRVIRYAQGLPLALEVIGSHLCGKSIPEWESELDVYRRIPKRDIQQVLKVSYDGLEEAEKEIFLDIACFFKGNKLEYAIDMVKHVHPFDPDSAIRVLKDKCLIKIDVFYIEMHNLIQDMGREIVRQESPKEPGKRSRLWFHDDITHVLEENTGTDGINVIIQNDLSKRMEVNWDGEAFKNMKNLKILIFENAKFSKGPKYLPNSLKVLKWRGYPSSWLPLDFCPRKLVALELPHSCINFQEPIKELNNLSVLNFIGCQYLTQIPNLSGIPGLKELRLDYCKNLIEIHDSVGYLAKLKTLSVDGCCQLRTFPHQIKLPSLELLSLDGCSSLNYFPETLEKIEYIEGVYLKRTGITKLPLSICNLTGLGVLSIEKHERGIELPSSVAMFRRLSLIKCNISDEVLRMYLSSFPIVKYLDLTSNNFTILPACIKECRFLSELVLNDCKHLRDVQGIPPNITCLEAIDCVSLSSESRNLILSQESLRAAIRNRRDLRNRYIHGAVFTMPGAKIPRWFDHCSGGRAISFWFRNKCPTVAICIAISTNDERRMMEEYNQQLGVIGFINGTKCLDVKVNVMYALDGKDHILVYDPNHMYEMKNAFREKEWNHVVVCTDLTIYTTTDLMVEESGIYVIERDCSMEDIQFPNPHERLDDDLVSYIASKQDYLYRKNYSWVLKNETFWWEAPLDDHVMNRVSLPKLSWSGHASDNVSNQEDNINNGSDWLSLRPCWEAPLDYLVMSRVSLPKLSWSGHASDNVSNQDVDGELFVTNVKETEPMLKKRRLKENDSLALSSTAIAFRCKKRGENYLVNQDENDENPTHTQSLNASDTINNFSLTYDVKEKYITRCNNDSKRISLSLLAMDDGNKASLSGYTNDNISNQEDNINNGSDWLSLCPCWEAPLDDHVMNRVSLPKLSWSGHASDNVSNQDVDGELFVTNVKETQPMLKKRRLKENDSLASSSTAIAFRCTNRGRNYLVNEDENDANTAHTQFPNASDTSNNQEAEQEPSVTSRKELYGNLLQTSINEYESNAKIRDTQSPKSRANEGSIHVRRQDANKDDRGVCQAQYMKSQEDEALMQQQILQSSENVTKVKGKDIIVYKDDSCDKKGDNMAEVTCQNHIYSSNGESLTGDPMEWEYQLTCQRST